MRRYFVRKLVTYILTFFVAVTVDWMIPRFMPGDPVSGMISRMSLQPEAANRMMGYYTGRVRARPSRSGSSTSTSGSHCSTAIWASASGCSRGR